MQGYEGSIGELSQKVCELEERNRMLADRIEQNKQELADSKQNKVNKIL